MKDYRKDEYSKEKGYQGDKSKSYQATNKPNDNSRNPNAPTQGGFSTPGGGQGQPLKDKTKTQGNKPNQPNTWGTGSINDKSSNKDRR